MRLFMLALFGTGVACLALAIWSLTDLGASQSPLLFGAAVLYLIAVIGLTIGYHVPPQRRPGGRARHGY
jgi:uncharacterized membrane protein